VGQDEIVRAASQPRNTGGPAASTSGFTNPLQVVNLPHARS
jgi:hypothetical protein